MAIPIVKELSEITGLPVKEVDNLFSQAKAEAFKTFNNKSGDFNSYSLRILKRKLGLPELVISRLKAGKNNA